MSALSDQLSAILAEHAMSAADHQRLDGYGQSAFEFREIDVWGWTVEANCSYVRVTAQAGPVTRNRAEAIAAGEGLYGRLTAVLPPAAHVSVGARSIYDRVNQVVVGWVGDVRVRADHPRE
ncbi:hypothetical protein KZZ52_23755 [Dactylosporangium sp. AC04546]|uniref:hypothetical protein n=1 Tax=Dactylosporangium sp. AC04546 TaxID=2862460 RepID=UPI001EDF5008|nr:hypothetical protein [Dactylosporangium sp. AC04546]WVK88293.1 hypothetical protein KZZ52_23755 [Dactylosporangium sp. AC04546]